MKIGIIQPKYSFNEGELDERFDDLIGLFDECDDSMDIIVVPEYSDAPADIKGKYGFGVVKDNGERLIEKAKQTAKRCSALVFSMRDMRLKRAFVTQLMLLTVAVKL